MPQPTPIVIAIAGGPASGKKSVQSALKSALETLHAAPFTVYTLHQTDFLRRPTTLHSTASAVNATADAERQEAYDLDALTDAITRQGQGADVVIVEGTYVLAFRRIVERADVKVFVDCDSDVRLARRVVRDLALGTPLDSIFEQHVRYSKTCYERTILPTKQISDIILPGGGSWSAGVELIAHGVVDDLVGKRGGVKATAGGKVDTMGLPLVLGETDLGVGMPSYYETV
ncbi:hypothetical protein FN846DRAFT_955947 [Sphaerosporella brunnea]|uniref:Phosphoribulokinase/uridine kinase domain-containing protein n=1 Tax=Sphaerosporella brunnea TaxID=1250544 RepID=A0A5J5ETZ9_9PEZI|nr:hypothetical protein FN846DRAFT_955947 [Sphaerosporella brunnea]